MVLVSYWLKIAIDLVEKNMIKGVCSVKAQCIVESEFTEKINVDLTGRFL